MTNRLFKIYYRLLCRKSIFFYGSYPPYHGAKGRLVSDVKSWSIEKMAERTVKALQANYFDAAFFKDRENLIERVMGHIKPKIKVGFGGSLTVRDLGIVDRLKTEDVVILDHWQQGLSHGDIADIRKEQLTSDLFLSSANAITENDLFFMVLDKIRYFSENTFGYNCIQEDIRT